MSQETIKQLTRLKELLQEEGEREGIYQNVPGIQALTEAIASLELMEQAGKGMPEKIKQEHTCEFDCKGCVASGWNQALDLCQAHWARKVAGIEELLNKMLFNRLKHQGLTPADFYGIRQEHNKQLLHEVAQALTEHLLKEER